MQTELTMATYNIHRGIGTDGIMNLRRIVEVIHEINADVIGLQEIDTHCMTEEGHQLNYIANHTGYNVIAGTNVIRDDAHYGNALLTRHKIVNVRKIDLSVGEYQPRGAIDADLDILGKIYRIVVTHFGLEYSERQLQFSGLLKELDFDERPIIMLGDFNEWLPFFGRLRQVRENFAEGPSEATYPTQLPVFRLDQIFVHPRDYLIQSRAHRSSLAKRSSDHLPAIAKIKLA